MANDRQLEAESMFLPYNETSAISLDSKLIEVNKTLKLLKKRSSFYDELDIEFERIHEDIRAVRLKIKILAEKIKTRKEKIAEHRREKELLQVKQQKHEVHFPRPFKLGKVVHSPLPTIPEQAFQEIEEEKVIQKPYRSYMDKRTPSFFAISEQKIDSVPRLKLPNIKKDYNANNSDSSNGGKSSHRQKK